MATVETLNVKIEANASSLKKETKDSVNSLDRLKNSIDGVRDKLKNPMRLNANQYSAQIENLEMQISDLKSLVESEWGRADLGSDGVTRVQAKIEQLNNQLNGLLQKQEEVNANWNNSGSGLNALLSKLKKIGLAVLGIRSVFSLISKSMRTYLSQNEELQAKLDGIYYSIGSMFAPLLEWVVNLFARIVFYVNAFLQALGFAGIRMRGISKSAKQIQKSLAGFDEINNLNSNESGGSGGGIGDPFKDLQVNTKFLDFIKEKAQEILAIVSGVITTIGLLLLGMKDKLMAMGFGVIIAGIVSLVQDLIAYIKDPSWENLVKILMDIAVIIAGIAIAVGAVTGPWAIALAAICALVLLFKDDIAKILVEIGTGIVEWFKKTWEAIKQKWNEMVTAAKDLWNALKDAIMNSGFNLKNDLSQLWQNIKTGSVQLWNQLKTELSRTWEQMKTVVSNAVTNMKNGITTAWNNIKSVTTSVFNGLKSTLSNIWNGLWNIIKGVLNKIIGGVESMVNGCIRGINRLTEGIRGLGNSVLKLIGVSFSFGEISTISLPRLNTGTNYVPKDMIAQLHEGEAVVPKRFNEEQFMNSEETNRLLAQLIEIVDSKEFRAYVSSSDVGRASTQFISNQSRLLGRSVI